MTSLLEPGFPGRPVSGGLFDSLGREPAFCVDRGLATHTCGSHGLALVSVGDIARREHPFDIGATISGREFDVPLFIKLDALVFQAFLCRGGADWG